MNKKMGLQCLVSALILLLSSIAIAQDKPPRAFRVSVYEIAAGTAPSFEEFIMKFKTAADQLKNTPTYYTFSPGIGNDRQYSFASPFNSFGELSEQRLLLAEVYKPEEVKRLLGLLKDSVVDTRSFVVIPRPDLSIPAPTDNQSEITLSLAITLKMGMESQFIEYMQKLIEASKAVAKDSYWITLQPGFGAGRNWSVRIAMKWKDLDTPIKPLPQRLTEHFGKRAGERIFESGQASIENITYSVQRARPDLSHTAAM